MARGGGEREREPISLLSPCHFPLRPLCLLSLSSRLKVSYIVVPAICQGTLKCLCSTQCVLETITSDLLFLFLFFSLSCERLREKESDFFTLQRERERERDGAFRMSLSHAKWNIVYVTLQTFVTCM